jgi:hypothetical protein
MVAYAFLELVGKKLVTAISVNVAFGPKYPIVCFILPYSPPLVSIEKPVC